MSGIELKQLASEVQTPAFPAENQMTKHEISSNEEIMSTYLQPSDALGQSLLRNSSSIQQFNASEMGDTKRK